MIKGLKNWRLILLILIYNGFAFALTGQKRLILPTSLNENSGLVFINADSCWWINDSDNEAELILTNSNGKDVRIYSLQGTNTDWEDLSQDDMGNLFIGDIGDNARKRSSYKFYKYDPSTKSLDSILFKYGGNQSVSHDCESFVWFENNIHLFTKGAVDKKDFICNHYSMDDHTTIQNSKLRGSINLKPFVVTGACISPDGKTLALLSYRYKFVLGILPDTDSRIYFFEIGDSLETVFRRPIGYYTLPTWLTTRQYESIDFIDSNHLMLGAEKTAFLKPMIRKIKIPGKLKSWSRQTNFQLD